MNDAKTGEPATTPPAPRPNLLRGGVVNEAGKEMVQAPVDSLWSVSYQRLTACSENVMATTRLSSKGQIVLPKSIRDALAWPVGAKLNVERAGRGITIERADDIRPRGIEEVIGMFKIDRPISDEEIEQSIEKGYRARWRRKQ